MKYQLTIQVEVASSQKATALRDKLADIAQQDEDVAVLGWGASQETRTFEVIGVDLDTEEPFTEQVEAEDEEAAREQIKAPKVAARVVESRFGPPRAAD
jgi:hypothetical protein